MATKTRTVKTTETTYAVTLETIRLGLLAQGHPVPGKLEVWIQPTFPLHSNGHFDFGDEAFDMHAKTTEVAITDGE